MNTNKALLIIDLQNDFVEGGALAVRRGLELIPIANQLMNSGDYQKIIATQDWHPANHESFASQHPGHAIGELVELHGLQQILWPDHCIQNSFGAEFVKGLEVSKFDFVVQKGTHPQIDSYSGFFDNGHRQATALEGYLRQNNIENVDVMGLATDYCVKFTALDAVKLGFRTRVLRHACFAVNLNVGDEEESFREMELAGVLMG